MARANLFRLETWPFAGQFPSTWTFGNSLLNNASSKISWFVQINDIETITHVGVRLERIIGTAPTYKVSFRNIDADGTADPNPITSVNYQPVAEDLNKFVWLELISPFSAPRGKFVAIVIEYASGTIGTSNAAGFSTRVEGASLAQINFPYSIVSGERNTKPPIVAWKNNNRAWGWPVEEIRKDVTQFPEERGMRFWFPPNLGRNFRISGVRFTGRLAGSTGKGLDVFLADIATDTELQRVQIDCDNAPHAGQADAQYDVYFPDPIFTIDFGVEYVIGFSPQNATTDFWLTTIQCSASLDMNAFPGGGQMYEVTRHLAVTREWTRNKANRPMVSLIVEDWNG